MQSHRCNKISTQQGRKAKTNDDRENDSQTYGVYPRREIGTGLLDFVDRVECILDRGYPDGSRPDCGDESKCHLARGRGSRCLIKSVKNGPERRGGNYERKIVEKSVVKVEG